MSDISDKYLPFMKNYEGDVKNKGEPVNHLYLDINGHLTIGFGHLVLHRSAAKADWKSLIRKDVTRINNSFPIVCDDNDSSSDADSSTRARPVGPAGAPGNASSPLHDHARPGPWDANGGDVEESPVDIMSKEGLEMMGKGFGGNIGAGASEQYTTCRLKNPADFEKLAVKDVDKMVNSLLQKNAYHEFKDFPMEGRLAVLDLAYQKGAMGLAKHYKEFGEAVKGRHWNKAAELCPKLPGDPERTRQRVEWLKGAALKDPKNKEVPDPDSVKKPKPEKQSPLQMPLG